MPWSYPNGGAVLPMFSIITECISIDYNNLKQ